MKRTFFDTGVQIKQRQQEGEEGKENADKEEEDPVWSSIVQKPDLMLSSLDLTVYANLKEELVNTPQSDEVEYLKEKCPKLMKFVKLMDAIFAPDSSCEQANQQDNDNSNP